MLADLELLHGQTIDSTRTLLQSRLPAGLHLAVVGGHGAGVGELGQLVTGHRVAPDAGWSVLAPALRAALPDGAAALMLPAPPRAVVAAAPPVPRVPATLAPVLPTPVLPAPVLPASVPAAPVPPLPAVPVAVPLAAPAQDGPAAPTPGKTPPVAAPAKLHARPHRNLPSHAPPSDRVARLQSAMVAQGTFAGPVNGLLDDRTAAAISVTQSRLGHAPTGVFTQPEIIRLLNPSGTAP